MDIKTLESYRLSDAVKFHNELNPLIWVNNRLRPEVKKQLKLVAEDFLEELGISGLDVVDLTISGSNAAYSYTPHSDLDLHILVDMKKFQDEVYRELFTAKKNIYNDTHNIKIHGIPVELYVQDINEPVISLGEYSLLKDQWIKIPSKRRANLDQTAVKSKYEKLRKLINHALKSNDLKLINKILKKIKQYRQAGLDKAGEFGPENLAYKILRNQDYITKLYDLRDKLHSEELTIETMYSTPGGKNKLLNRPKLTIRKIAAKHDVPLKDILDQLKKGISVEKKHTTYAQTARDIALDHLSYDPKYYSKTQKVQVEEEDDNDDFDELPEKVYHITPAENLDNIMSRGLLPKIGDRARKILDEKPAVYCFPDKVSMEDAMMNWLGDEFDEDESLALLEIDTDGLKGHVTDGAKYEVAITSKILPNRIRVLSKDLATPINESYRKIARYTDEDYDPNGPPPGPEFKPTMPKGTVRVDVSDVYDWYKLGQHISNMKGLGKHDFGKGPPSTILSFGDEDTEHQYIKDLEKTGLKTTDIDPIDPNQPKGMKRQKVDPTFNVNEDEEELKAIVLQNLPRYFKDGDPLERLIPERKNVTYGLHPDKWQSTFYSLTGKDPEKIKFYKPKSSSIIPGTLVGDMAIANQFYRAKTEEEKLKFALEYKKSLRLIEQANINDYRMPELLIPNTVAESASGYIPSKKEANDLRYKTALTVDVKPNTIQKNAKAFGFKISRAGIPPLLREGKVDSVAFHGTRNKIKSFKPFTHFGTFIAAKERLEHTDEGYPLDSDIIYKVDLNITNPAHIDSDIYGNHKLIDYVTGLQNNKIINPNEAESIKSPSDLIKLLTSKGYDGISYKNKWEDVGSKSYVIFDPNQATITDIITWGNDKMLKYQKKFKKL